MNEQQALRTLIEGDLHLFCREILGYRLLRDQPHVDVCTFIERWDKRKKMLLMPRGVFKSTIASISYPIQEIIKNPNIRILLASETIGQAQRLLREVKGHLEQNQILHGLYGNPVVDVGWKESELTVAWRTQNKKEPTIGTAGTEAARVGSHWDLIICDDVHSEINTANADQMLKVLDWFRLLLSQLEPDGRILVIGTRWADGDLYGHIIDTLADTYDIKIEKAVRDDGSLFYPERLTKEFLEEQQREQGSFLFSAQYQLECVPESEQSFKPSWFKYGVPQTQDLISFILVDPAMTQRESVKGDSTAIVTVSIDPQNNWYVVDLVDQKLSPKDINDLLVDRIRRYRPIKVGFESVSFGKLLHASFEQECRRQGLAVTVVPITHGRVAKEARIRGLQPFFERGQVYFAARPDAVQRDAWYHLHEQLTRFPKAKHDDLPDALSFLLELQWMRNATPIETDEQRSNRIFNEHMKKNRKQRGERYAMTMA